MHYEKITNVKTFVNNNSIPFTLNSQQLQYLLAENQGNSGIRIRSIATLDVIHPLISERKIKFR